MANIEFDTGEYYRSHGKEPRGTGSWAFFFDGDRDPMKAWFTPGNTTYNQAKKMAKAEAIRRFGADAEGIIRVGS